MKTQNKILRTLRDQGGITPSRIAGMNGLNYTYTMLLLRDLEKDKLVTMNHFKTITICEITKEGLLKLKQGERRSK